jgi:hypothetical protein
MTGFDPEQWLSLQTLAIFIKSLAFSSHFLALLAKKLPEYPGREELNYTNLLAITEVSGKIASHFRNPAILSSIEFDHNENDDEGDGDLKDDGVIYLYLYICILTVVLKKRVTVILKLKLTIKLKNKLTIMLKLTIMSKVMNITLM